MPIRVGLSVVVVVSVLAGLDWPRSALGQEGAFHSQVDLVSVYFTVRDDKKHLASDLAQDKFSVSEDGQPQVIKLFAHHSDVVLNVGVLLDTGTNMSWILGEEAQAAKLFMKHVVRPTDLGFILSYASRVETVQLPTSDVALLEEKADTVGSEAAIGLPDQGPSLARRSGGQPHIGKISQINDRTHLPAGKRL
jgi:VWFA-related protein